MRKFTAVTLVINIKIGPQELSSFDKLQIFARHDNAYLLYDIHMNNVRIHFHLVGDINKEKKPKYGY